MYERSGEKWSRTSCEPDASAGPAPGTAMPGVVVIEVGPELYGSAATGAVGFFCRRRKCTTALNRSTVMCPASGTGERFVGAFNWVRAVMITNPGERAPNPRARGQPRPVALGAPPCLIDEQVQPLK